jgi:hypothetical protein
VLTMHNRTSGPIDYCSGLIGSVIALFVVLTCLVVADTLLWPGESTDQARHENVAKAR